MLHDGAAILTGVKEMSIDEEEAKLLGKSTAELMAEYNKTMDPKTLKWILLFNAVMVVEGPRAMLIREQINERRKKKAPIEGAFSVVS